MRSGVGLTVGAVVFAGTVAALQVGKVPAAGPLLGAGLGLSVSQIGALSAAIAVLGVLGSLPAGALGAALGARRVLAAGLVALAIGAGLGAVADSFPALLASRLVEGIGFLAVIVAGPSAIDRLVSGRTRDLAYAVWSCALPTGFAAALIAGPHFTQWPAIASTGALLAALALVAVLLALRTDGAVRRISAAGLAASMRTALHGRGARVLGAVFLLYSLMFFAVFSFLPILLVATLRLEPVMAGTLSGIASAANIAGNLAAGVLLARWGAPRLVAIAAIVMTACGLGIFLAGFPAWPTFALCLAFSAAGGLLPATALATAPRVSPSSSHVPLTLAVLMQGSNTGQALGPMAIGALVQASGWSAAGVGILGAGGLLLVCAGALGRTLARTQPAGRVHAERHALPCEHP